MTADQIIALVDALVWPVVVITVLLLFRGRIKDLLKRSDLEAVQAGPVSLKFREKLDDAAKQLPAGADSSVTEVGPDDVPRSEIEDTRVSEFGELREVAQVSPDGAVVIAFGRLENALRDRMAPEYMGTLPPSLHKLIVRANAAGLLSSGQVAALNDLREARNLLAHGRSASVSTDLALEYIDLCEDVVRQLGGPDDPGASGTFAPSPS